jgi:exopolysaccharide biosynthesis polyprenyl glycosylphosphotransferase
MRNLSRLSESPQVEPDWLMPLVDAVLVGLAFVVAYLLRYDLQIIRPVLDPVRYDFASYLPYVLVYALILVLNSQGSGLYTRVRGRTLGEEIVKIVNSVTISTVILLALFFLLQPTVTSRLMLLYVAVLVVLFQTIARMGRRVALARLRRKGIGVQRTLIAGMADTGQTVLRTLLARQDLGFVVVGYVDDNPQRGDTDLGRVRGMGSLEHLATVIKEQKVDLVVITLRWKHYDRIQEIARVCRRAGVEVRIVPDIFQLNMRQVAVETVNGIPLLGVQEPQSFEGPRRVVKRAVDLGLILLTAPLWLAVWGLAALAIKLDSPDGAVLYWQQRIGEHGRPFRMAKFRTMVPNADQMHQQIVADAGADPRHPKLRDDPRITQVGRFLRRTSIDELPNLLNVLHGEMSIIGPRPATPDEVRLYEPWHRQRLNFIPGMTGLWQVSGRSDVPFDEMCLLDIYYIENWSVAMDAQILLRTVPRVLLQRGAY